MQLSAQVWFCGTITLLAFAAALPAIGQQGPSVGTVADACQPSDMKLADAPDVERQALSRMMKDPLWPRRAVAALRLERFGCDGSRDNLIAMLKDPAWQVRAFASRSLARRGVYTGGDWFVDEHEPRVLRAALRHRYAIDAERLERGVRFLTRSSKLDDKMLAAELGAASGQDELEDLARENVKTIMLRMTRAECGEFSPRLSGLTGAPDFRRPIDWQNWLMKTGRRLEVKPCWAIGEGASKVHTPTLLSQMNAEAFAGVEDYMIDLAERSLDLAIVLDCTASMGRQLAEAQGGADDLMQFVGSMVESLRVGIVGYRDRRDEFETKAWDFTTSVETARENLWQLTADGGGDARESVYKALMQAYSQFSWKPSSTKVLVLIGDAPPHVGQGELSINLARRARGNAELATHVIQARGKEVEHFAEIATAGGGRCVNLEERDSLVAQIAGLTLGDQYEEEFGEFFRIYLELCR
jgi:hypothetical protein